MEKLPEKMHRALERLTQYADPYDWWLWTADELSEQLAEQGYIDLPETRRPTLTRKGVDYRRAFFPTQDERISDLQALLQEAQKAISPFKTHYQLAEQSRYFRLHREAEFTMPNADATAGHRLRMIDMLMLTVVGLKIDAAIEMATTTVEAPTKTETPLTNDEREFMRRPNSERYPNTFEEILLAQQLVARGLLEASNTIARMQVYAPRYEWTDQGYAVMGKGESTDGSE